MVGLGLAIVALFQGPRELRDHLAGDTSQAVREARAAAAAFERLRRFQLPVTHGGFGRCDERIGRFCYWYDEGDTTLPKEPDAVRRSRAKLLEALATAQRAVPASDWLIGQRVHYLVEQREHDAAIEVATRCGGTAWWCSALLGMALHTGERFAAADSSFTAALAGAPEEIRCAWSDWRKLLEGNLRERFERMACPEREALADSLLWLGQPLLANSGNDFRTELLSRRVVATLQSVAVSSFLTSWGDDVEELLLRYGWPTRWSVSDYPGLRTEPPSLIGHERSPAYSFWPVPMPGDGGDPLDPQWSWELKPERPRSRYAPSYGSWFGETESFQIARFPRGDSTLIVGALDLGDDPSFRGPVALRLAAAMGPGHPATVAATDTAPSLGGLLLRVGGAPVLAGLEANPSGGLRFLRARVTLAGAVGSTSLALSDPLLFLATGELPETLEAAARLALSGGKVSKRRPIGVYWEVSGPGTDSVEVSVAVIPIRRGLMGRIAQGLSLVKRRAPFTLQWRAAGRQEQSVGRAFELDLRQLRTGQYFLRLEASIPGAASASAVTRRFDLTS
jgi:hypothetical protein